MARFAYFIAEYISSDEDQASMTDEAVSQLEKSQWNHLKHLDLCTNVVK